MAKIIDLMAVVQAREARERARTEARLRVERDAAGAAYVAAVQHGAEILRQAGWREGDPSAPILGSHLVNEARQAADLLLASDAALQGWPGPLPDAAR